MNDHKTLTTGENIMFMAIKKMVKLNCTLEFINKFTSNVDPTEIKINEKQINELIIYACVKYNKYHLIDILLSKYDKFNDNVMYVLLKKACFNGYFEIVKIFVEHGVSVYDELGHLVCLKTNKNENRMKIIDILIEHGVDINTQFISKKNNYFNAYKNNIPINISFLRHNYDMVKHLIEKKSYVNEKIVVNVYDKVFKNCTLVTHLIIEASKIQHCELVTLLFENGADTNVCQELIDFSGIIVSRIDFAYIIIKLNNKKLLDICKYYKAL
jgi:ankyrin repeat protein